MGEFTYGNGGWKGEAFVDFLREFDLTVTNTMEKDPVDSWTHLTLTQQGLEDPRKQIDYICVSRELRSKAVCRVSETDATSSDHRALKLKLQGNFTSEDGARHRWKKKNPKPIGWKCHDFTFASRVGEALEVAGDLRPTHDERSDARSFHLWTDGSFKKSRHGNPSKGGWALHYLNKEYQIQQGKKFKLKKISYSKLLGQYL